MMLTNGIVKPLFLCALLCLSIAACTPAPRHTDSYVGAGGEVTILENDREACVRSCNAEYDRCGDARASQGVGYNGQMQGVLGGAADCRADLKSCLSMCKTR